MTNLWVQLLQILQAQVVPHELLVQHHGELEFEDVAVVDGEAWWGKGIIGGSPRQCDGTWGQAGEKKGARKGCCCSRPLQD